MADPLGAFMPPHDLEIVGSTKGPISGFSFAVKDIFDIKGLVTGCGNPDWARTHGPAAATAPVVTRCLEAGATCLGKTITDELAFSINGENHHYGTPANPVAPDRIPGGSSSGSASAVAGGAVTFALGSDTGGSVRIPASYCGLFGLRPTHGRIALDGAMPLAPRFDTVGWLARDASVLWLVGEVMLPDEGDETPISTVWLPADLWALADPATQAALRPLARGIGRDLGRVREDPLAAGPGFDAWLDAYRHLLAKEIWQHHRAWIERERPSFGPGVAERIAWLPTVTRQQIEVAEDTMALARAHLAEAIPPGTLILMPTTPHAPPKRGEPVEALREVRARALKLTCVAGLGGLPQLTLPLAKLEAGPIGLSMLGARGTDETLLETASRLGAEREWVWREGVLAGG